MKNGWGFGWLDSRLSGPLLATIELMPGSDSPLLTLEARGTLPPDLLLLLFVLLFISRHVFLLLA